MEDKELGHDLQRITEVAIIPERLLGDKTTKKILLGLRQLEGIKSIVLQGPSYISRKLDIGDQVIHPTVKVGKFLVEIEDVQVIEEIKYVCSECLPFSYDISVSTYRRKPTVTTSMGKIPVKALGMLRMEEERE
jgi:methyl coenzyme M reductase subunit D